VSSGPTLRHGPARSGAAPAGDEKAHAAVIARLETELGAKVGMVFHELVSDLVHVDVHHVPPTRQRPSHAFFTTGMSDRAMTVPAGAPSSGFAELLVLLPADWKVDQAAWNDERWYWPIRWMKILARLPHAHRTWLSHGHTIPNGDPAAPFAGGTLLTGMCLVTLFDDHDRPVSVPVRDDKHVELFELYPFTTAEMDLKLKTSAEHVMRGLGAAGVGRAIQHDRACTVTGKKPGGGGSGFFGRFFGG
jgi:hypothetical protein